MANNSLILNWILNNSAKYNIILKKDNGVKEIHNDLFNYHCQLDYKGTVYHGHSVDFNEEMAIIKSFSESIERLCLSTTDQTNSSGFSVHTSEEKAKELALNELIERDAFLNFFYKRVSILNITSVADNKYKEISAHLNKKGVETKLFQLQSANNARVFMTLLNFKKCNGQGIIIGLAGPGEFETANKSLLECIFDASLVFNNNYINKDIDIDEFKNRNPDPLNHFLLGLNPQYADRFIEKIEICQNNKISYPSKDISKTSYKKISIPLPGLESILKCVKASSDSLLKMTFGDSENFINHSKTPHPFS